MRIKAKLYPYPLLESCFGQCDYVDSKNDKRMTIDYAVGKIYKIANKCKLKPMYIIGGKYKMLYFLTRFAPKSWYLNIVEKHFGGHKKLKKD